MSARKERSAPSWWVDEESTHENGISILGPRRKCDWAGLKNTWQVAKVDNGSFPEHEEIDWANARLIAAAPDLLDALEAYQDQNRMHNDTEADLYEKARVAIKKVRGQ